MPLRPVGGLCNLKWHACCILMTEVYESLSLKTNERKQRKEESIFFFLSQEYSSPSKYSVSCGCYVFCKHLERPYLKRVLLLHRVFCAAVP